MNQNVLTTLSRHDALPISAAGDSWHAQVIAILELSAELLPGPSSYELTQALNVAADEASPDIMEEAKMLRDLFAPLFAPNAQTATRSEEHTSELQSLMRISYAVFCLTKITPQQTKH